jgi:hypothetical protein
MRDALSLDEAALSARLSQQAQRLKVLRADADGAAAALRAAELELQRARATAAGEVSRQTVAELQAGLRTAKEEQAAALQRAVAEHESLLTRALEERGARLAAAAQAAEARVAALTAEDAELKRRLGELAAEVAARKAEADASLQRRQRLTKEVEALKAALRASEQADDARLAALAAEVREVESAILATRNAGDELGPLAALRDAEDEARAAARAQWQSEVARVREAGEASVSAAREAGRRQYEDLVRSMEERYVAEFEATLASIRARQAADVERTGQLSTRLAEARAALASAREQRAKLEADISDARAKSEEVTAAKRARLELLKRMVRDAWAARAVEPATVAAFLRRVASATPYTSAVHGLYESKIAELKAAAPLYQGITRREVLRLRLGQIRRSLADLLAQMSSSMTSMPVASAPMASSLLLEARQTQIRALQKEYGLASAELEMLTDVLVRDVQTFETTTGRAFLYRGARYLELLQAEAAAEAGPGGSPLAPSGSPGAAPMFSAPSLSVPGYGMFSASYASYAPLAAAPGGASGSPGPLGASALTARTWSSPQSPAYPTGRTSPDDMAVRMPPASVAARAKAAPATSATTAVVGTLAAAPPPTRGAARPVPRG